MTLCLCGTGKPYSQCCEPLHHGLKRAQTAEQLMRSRYSAFCTKNVDYLYTTHDSATRGKMLREELSASMGTIQWLRLEVLQTTDGSTADITGYVRFTAHFLDKGRPDKMEELSLFTKKKGCWYYTSGE